MATDGQCRELGGSLDALRMGLLHMDSTKERKDKTATQSMMHTGQEMWHVGTGAIRPLCHIGECSADPNTEGILQ